MKLFVFLLLAISPPDESLLLMFWNVENFFDCSDSGQNDSDREFSPMGERRWTYSRFKAKCSAIVKTMLWIAQEEGRLPDVVGLAEVENSTVLKRLIYGTLLKKTDYAYVHFDSPDPRGIDVALLYRKDRLTLSDARPCRIEEFRTRDILEAGFVTAQGDSLAVMICHLPSKYGGVSSIGRREVAVSRLLSAADSLETEGWREMAILGDFNDVVGAESFAPLYTRFSALSGGQRGGTIKFSGVWETIDQAFVTNRLSGRAEVSIVSAPFLETVDKEYGGVKPLRTYSGPRYLGGVSDHLPIILRIR